jgi:hypothetical protein
LSETLDEAVQRKREEQAAKNKAADAARRPEKGSKGKGKSPADEGNR